MTKLSKKLWMALLPGAVLLICYSSDALAFDPVQGNTTVRGFKTMTGTVGVGNGPTSIFREYSTGVPDYSPGSGPTGIFANGNAATTPGAYGGHDRSGNMVDTRQNTIMRANRLNFADRQSNLANQSSGLGALGRQKPTRGQSGNKLAKPLSSELPYAPDLAAPANNWTANTLFGGKYAKPGLGSKGSESYGGGLAQRKSALNGGQSAFGTSASSLTQQRNQFRYNAANLGQAKKSSVFGHMSGITDKASLAGSASSLK
jgi:hypothetical protein